MEILQNIWIALTTANDGLTNIIFNKFGIPFIFIELTVNMLLFTTVLDIKSNKKQKITYVLSCFLVSCISNLIFDKPYSSYINMVACPIIVFFVFKVNVLKSVIAEIIPAIITSLIEILFARLFLLIFNVPYEFTFTIPLYRISVTLSIYFIIFLIYLILKNFKYSIFLSDNLSRNNKIVIFVNSIIGIITIGMQFYLLGYYNDIMPLGIIILSILTFNAYFFISIFSLLKTTKLDVTRQNLEQANDYINTLKLLYDDIRTFRHDFGNIVQAIGGYIDTNDMKGLKEYYKQLLIDCEDIKSLEMLNPTSIDNPAVYSLLTSKYHKASSLGIEMKIHVSLQLENLNMKIYEFTRILGILLDNAIEASEQCDDKIINLEIRKDVKSPRQVLIIQNTYLDKNIDLNRIREKGFTSKTVDDGKPHGLGLWEINKILRKSKNLNLYTTKDSIFFTQQLEIYDK